MHNEVKSEQCFAITFAKSVAVFQSSSEIISLEAGAQLSTKDNKYSTS